jgi:hypothetical protein
VARWILPCLDVLRPKAWRVLTDHGGDRLTDWALGVILLHLWAYLCYFGVLDGIWIQLRNNRAGPNRWQTAVKVSGRWD